MECTLYMRTMLTIGTLGLYKCFSCEKLMQGLSVIAGVHFPMIGGGGGGVRVRYGCLLCVTLQSPVTDIHWPLSQLLVAIVFVSIATAYIVHSVLWAAL